MLKGRHEKKTSFCGTGYHGGTWAFVPVNRGS